MKNSEPKIRNCFLYLLTWKRCLIRCAKGSYLFCFEAKGCPRIFGKWSYVSVDRELSNSFSVKVGVHQGLTLSLLLFIIVMDVLTEDVRDGSLMELLYAENLVLCGESLNEVMDKYGRRKDAVKGKGLRVNVNKTLLLFGKKSSASKVDPCGACGEWVGCNFILCKKCHHHCFDVPRQVSLLSCCDVFVYRTCLGHNCSVEEN